MNTFSLSCRLGTRAALVASLLFAAGCSTSPTATAPASQPSPLATTSATAPGAFSDDPRPMNANEAAVAAAGLDSAKLAALERRLLAVVVDPKSNAAAAQDAAQQLGFVALARSPEASASTLTTLAPLLADPARIDLARLVLDRIPGAEVDALYVAALPAATGRARLGVIDTLGTRRVVAAVPALAPLLKDADPATAAAAATALGRIGGTRALAALDGASQPLSPVVLTARLAAAAKVDATTAARVAAEITRNAQAPLAPRTAALRQLIAAAPANAVTEIDAALTGSEPAFQAVALEAVTTLSSPGAASALADRLPTYPPAVQARLAAALAATGEASAVPGLLPLLASPEAAVRLATIEALGRLPGTPEIAQELVYLALTATDDAKAAKTALVRLNGPEVDAFVRQAAADATRSGAERVVFIQLIGERNLTAAMPFLLGLRESTDAALRSEALDTLRLIAAPADQGAVISWALGAADRAEQNRAVRTLITIILRDDAVESRAAPVVAALKGGTVADRLALLPVLSRVGGTLALDAADSLAREADSAVALAATAELARWPDASALPVLVELATTTDLAAIRNAALTAAARFLEQPTEAVRINRSAQTQTLLDLPLNASMRQRLLNVLSLCADKPALETAQTLLTDPALTVAAQDAVDAITSNLAGPALVTASGDPDKTAVLTDGDAATIWQVPGEVGTWLRVDLHHSRPVRKIFLEHGARNWGYPAKMDIQVSDNPDAPGTVVAQGKGQRETSVFTLPAGVRGRYVWLRVTAFRDTPLAIAELRVE